MFQTFIKKENESWIWKIVGKMRNSMGKRQNFKWLSYDDWHISPKQNIATRQLDLLSIISLFLNLIEGRL